MALRVASWLARPWVLRTLLREVRLAIRLMREPLVPVYLKAIPLLGLLYVVSPLDFVPDVLPFLGQLDDLGIVLVAMKAFVKLCPAAAASFHSTEISKGRQYSAMAQSDYVIDAEFRPE